MTVADLIRRLKMFDLNAPVIIRLGSAAICDPVDGVTLAQAKTRGPEADPHYEISPRGDRKVVVLR